MRQRSDFRALVLATVGLISACSTEAGSPLAHRIDQIVESAVGAGVVAGASVAVVSAGEPVHIRGYGFASREDHRSAEPGTLFNIGSVTKIFTATAIMTLVEADVLGLDDPVGTWVEGVSELPGVRDVTVRQMLSHTSGPAKYGSADLDRWLETKEPLTRDFVLAFVADNAPVFAPGTHWDYNNTGFYFAGLVIEAASGLSWYEYLRHAVLDPLELNDVRLCDAVVDERARGYELTADRLEPADLYIEAGVRGDGGLCASAQDLTRFAERMDAGDLLSRSSTQTLKNPTRLVTGATVGYGLGVRLGALDGYDLWGHTGGHAGTIAVLVRFPEVDVTIAVLTNTIRSDRDALVLEGDIAAAVLEVPVVVPPSVEVADLSPFTGEFMGSRMRTRRLSAVDGRLIVTTADGSRGVLVPVGPSVFVQERPPFPLDRYVFDVRDGEVTSYSAYYNGLHSAFYQRIDP